MQQAEEMKLHDPKLGEFIGVQTSAMGTRDLENRIEDFRERKVIIRGHMEEEAIRET